MRTTLNIEEGALSVMKKYAEQRSISLGQAASDLVHRGAENVPEFKTKTVGSSSMFLSVRNL